MHYKTLTSIISLRNWSEKILNEAQGRDYLLRDFTEVFNMSEYRQFYFELEPFIRESGSQEEELINMIRIYENNGRAMDEALKENNFLSFLGRLASDLPFFARRADDLIHVIQDIRANVENLEYACRIREANQ